RSLEVLLAALIAVGVILTFWSQQRYPALLKKLHAGTGVKVAGAISFDALLKVTPEMPAPTRVMRTSVNWLYTNRFGMYFALPFGAALMTLLAGENGLAVRTIAIPNEERALGPRLVGFCRTYLRNLLRLTLLTLPWMLLAAVLGALAAETIPAYGTHLPVSLAGVVCVAILGTLLPVPMALDVALAYVLYHAGVPVPYVAVLLCTLGPVSVYSLSALG